MGQLSRSMTIVRKNMIIYYLKGPVIIFGVLIPAFFFLAFIMGRKDLPLSFLMAGLTSMTVFFTATSVSPVIMPWEAQMNTLERLIVSPISTASLLMGDVISSVIFSLLITLIPLALTMILRVTITDIPIFFLSVLISAICFSALGMVMAAPKTNIPSNIMMLASLIKFPLVFISGIFVPIEAMPPWGLLIASISPLTYLMDAVRYSLGGYHHYPLAMDMGMLLIFTAIFSVVAVKLHSRNIPRRI